MWSWKQLLLPLGLTSGESGRLCIGSSDPGLGTCSQPEVGGGGSKQRHPLISPSSGCRETVPVKAEGPEPCRCVHAGGEQVWMGDDPNPSRNKLPPSFEMTIHIHIL